MNASGGCEAAVTARIRTGWMKFREYGEILHGKNYSLKLKEKIYQSCVRSVMDVVFGGKGVVNSEKDRESNVWNEVDGQEKH